MVISMVTHRENQRWVQDFAIASSGWNSLHPEIEGRMEEIGFKHPDITRVFEGVKSTQHWPKALVRTALENEKKALYYEKRGFDLSARDLYVRAMLLFDKAQYSYYRDDFRKKGFHDKMLACFQRAAKITSENTGVRIEQVKLKFEGSRIYGVMYTPPTRGPHDCVLMIPGMDSTKEELFQPYLRYYLPHGLAAITFDGPGQGESLLNGCKVTLDNHEKASSAFVEYALSKDSIRKVAVYGNSMGSYWATRAAAHDKRLKACATALGCYANMNTIFNKAQPNFKANFMFMAGYEDEARFDAEFAPRMSLQAAVKKRTCPYLMMHGEFDELSPLDETIRLYEAANSPKELWIFADEFHSLGGVGQEVFSLSASWLSNALKGRVRSDHEKLVYMKRNGEFIEDSAGPDWWNPT
ncbi:MAG: alpha/beta hydrolase [Nitrososphaerota archaeon]|nr:alpha/beta hydrolase [Nitrososphaerota archaeon]